MNKIIVLGMGPGKEEFLTLKAYRLLKEGKFPIYLRTKIHPTVQFLDKEGISYTSFDSLYEEEEDFDVLYQKIAKCLVEKAKEEQTILYVVPGSPMVAEKTVEELIEYEKEGLLSLEIVSGVSFLDLMMEKAKIDPSEGILLLDALRMDVMDIDPDQHTFITQVYDQFTASETKLKLLEMYEDAMPITVMRGLGTEEEQIETVPLYELDRLSKIDHLTSIYIPKADLLNRNGYHMKDLLTVVAILRGEHGCVWDKEQTHESLLPQIIEETYEYVDAAQKGDIFNMYEELGDILLHVAMNSQIGQEEGLFSIKDVTTEICQKMIRRHPHVFGTVSVKDTEEVLVNWENIKKEEKGNKKEKGLFDGIPDAYPALLKAKKIQKKARSVGFDWDDPEDAVKKLTEEVEEFMEAYQKGSQESMEEELGDILFTLVNVGRFLSIDCETALIYSNNKFIERFYRMEKQIEEDHKKIQDLSLGEMDAYWGKIKK